MFDDSCGICNLPKKHLCTKTSKIFDFPHVKRQKVVNKKTIMDVS